MNNFSFFPVFLVMALLLLASCERPVNRIDHGLPLPVQTFAHVERLDVPVREVKISGDARKGGSRSNDFTVPFFDQALLYLSHKFKARGFGQDRVLVKIDRADVSHVKKQSSHEIFSRLGVDMVDEYMMHLNIRIEREDDAGRILMGEVVKVQKRFSVSEHDSPANRERKHFQAVEEVFKLIDPEVNRIVKGSVRF